MSTRLASFRQGDRAEYLALYYLSFLGLVTQIPRQEDIGFDFVCTLNDVEKAIYSGKEEDSESFSHPFIVTAKTKGRNSNIKLAPPAQWDGKSFTHLSKVTFLDSPLFVAVVDSDTMTVALYNTLSFWYIPYSCNGAIRSVTLKPRLNPKDKFPSKLPTEGKPMEGHPDSLHCEVDLGQPVITLSPEDLMKSNKDRRADKIMRLNRVLWSARCNIRWWQMQYPLMIWYHNTTGDWIKDDRRVESLPIGRNMRLRNEMKKHLFPMLCVWEDDFRKREIVDLADAIRNVRERIHIGR